jgi:two-component SAPR family response regulator
MTVGGIPVASDWPDETVKMLFCSLLSPQDRYVSWDRICHSMWGEPVTQVSRQHLEDIFFQPLKRFLITALGFNPLITGHEGIRVDHQRTRVDAFEFYTAATEGLRLVSCGSHAAAFEKFTRAKSLYNGIYLPGFTGKIITSTRNDLEALYLSAILDAMPLTRNSWSSERNRNAVMALQTRRPFQTLSYGHK